MYRVYRHMHGITDHKDFKTIVEACNFLDSRKSQMDWKEGAKFEVREIGNEESKL